MEKLFKHSSMVQEIIKSTENLRGMLPQNSIVKFHKPAENLRGILSKNPMAEFLKPYGNISRKLEYNKNIYAQLSLLEDQQRLILYTELKIDCSKNDIADIYQWQKFFELSTQILKKTLAEKKVKLLSLGKILSLILPTILGLATILGIALDIFSYIDADEKDLKNQANFITIGQQISANGKASKNQYLEVMQAIEKKQTLITALRSVSIAKKKAFIIRMTIFLSLGRKLR